MYLREMRALVREDGGPRLASAAVREPAAGEIAIEVAFAGVCRTDLAVADGRIAVARGRVLGHELAGRVLAVGDRVERIGPGDPVTAIPFIPCGGCTSCSDGGRCERPNWLGVDVDGAFAEHVCVPAMCVVRLPSGMSLVRGAYVEPVAAALGALAVVERGARVLVCGPGRISELTARVLEAHGAAVAREAWGGSSFDVVIEHDGGDPMAMLAMLRPGGTLVLKSRAHRRVAIDPGELVARDLAVRGASHGSFAAAVDWLHAGRIAIDDLLAPPRPLEEFEAVFEAERAGEQRKQMFAIRPEST